MAAWQTSISSSSSCMQTFLFCDYDSLLSKVIHVYIQAKIEYCAKSTNNSVSNFQFFKVSGDLSCKYYSQIILNGLMM